MNPRELYTTKLADDILGAPQEHFDLDQQWAPGALLDAIDGVILPHLSAIQAVGNEGRIIDLTLFRDRLEKPMLI